MKKSLVFLIFMISIGLAFCKKSFDVQDMLIGKWKIDSVQLRRFINDHVVYQTIYKPSVDYYDFRSDNKLYRLWMTTYDTVPYSIGSVRYNLLLPLILL